MTDETDCDLLREECESMYQEMVRKANEIIQLRQENEMLISVNKKAQQENEELRATLEEERRI